MTNVEDAKMVARVQALLAKAESTDFPHEAEALFAKAQELMTRHLIDDTLARARTSTDKPELRRLTMVAPYASAKFTLISAVGRANDVQVVGSANNVVTLFGYRIRPRRGRIAVCVAGGAGFPRNVPAPAKKWPCTAYARFRHSFLIAFAYQVEQRLQEAKQRTEAERRTRKPPVRSCRCSMPNATRSRNSPTRRFRTCSASVVSLSHAGGYHAGRDAAERADLGGTGRLDGASGRSLAALALPRIGDA